MTYERLWHNLKGNYWEKAKLGSKLKRRFISLIINFRTYRVFFFLNPNWLKYRDLHRSAKDFSALCAYIGNLYFNQMDLLSINNGTLTRSVFLLPSEKSDKSLWGRVQSQRHNRKYRRDFTLYLLGWATMSTGFLL